MATMVVLHPFPQRSNPSPKVGSSSALKSLRSLSKTSAARIQRWGGGFYGDLGIFLGKFGGEGEEFEEASFEVSVRECAAVGFKECGICDHFSQCS